MKNYRRLLTMYLVVTIFVVVGAWLKITHKSYASEILTIGLVFQAIFIVVHSVLIVKSNILDTIEKVIGMVLMFIAPMIAILGFHFIQNSRCKSKLV